MADLSHWWRCRWTGHADDPRVTIEEMDAEHQPAGWHPTYRDACEACACEMGRQANAMLRAAADLTRERRL